MFEKYVTKPEHIQAIKITLKNIEEVADLIGGRVTYSNELSNICLEYPTLASETFVVLVGDYLVKDSMQRLSAVKSAEFEEEFEKIKDPFYIPYDHRDL